MTKLALRADLDALRTELAASFDADKHRVFLCMGTGCKACGGDEILGGFDKALKRASLHDKVDVVMTGCRGFCENGALVAVRPPGTLSGTLYCRVSPDDIPDIVEKTIARGEVIDRLLYEMPSVVADTAGRRISAEEAIPFYQHQVRTVLGMNDRIDPSKIEDYIREGGYTGLSKALFEMSPDQIIDEVQRAGLRGRGGGGFPTGQKWKFCRNADGDTKYVICNADEGDPGAFMDRSLLEGNPHSVLEGMVIGARAIGASQGYIYIRAEYPLAIERLRIAIDQMREWGLLGGNILGSDFSFDIVIKEGAGAFVCGEETALIASIEGRRGMPMARPPFPADKGLFGKPTNINNVETWGNVPHIITGGAEAYARDTRNRTEQGDQDRLARRADQQHGPRRGADGDVTAPARLRGRWRGQGWSRTQSGAVGRPLGRLHPCADDAPADRLRVAPASRIDHGLGWPCRHGRDHLHGRSGALLPDVHTGRVLREMRPVPPRHAANADDPRRHLRGARHGGEHCAARVSWRGGLQGIALRPWPDRAEPGAHDDQVLP
jgi:(2Fe-2S) ferredoxin